MSDRTRPIDATAWMIDTASERIRPESMDGDFWQRLVAGEIAGEAMVTQFRLDGAFPHWEMHPQGDELFILHDGAIEVTLDRDGRQETFELRAGESCLIPAGAWHFARSIEPGRMTVVTFGNDTQHRPA